jgi:acylphosphatase
MVQGVCFRFVSRDLAKRYKLKGWVKNLADGRVELLVEGNEEDVNIFLGDIKKEFKANISDCQIKEQELKGYSDFKIVF